MGSMASDRDTLPTKRLSRHDVARKHHSLPTTDEYLELVAKFSADPLPQIMVNASSENVARQWRQSQQSTYTPTGLEAPIVAELRTNVIIKDEYTVITDLTQHLATQYGQQFSSIMLGLQHSSCLALGGNFASCYILTITTTGSNKASDQRKIAARIQSLLSEMLAVPANRGIVCFRPTPDGGEVAMNGASWAAATPQQQQQRPTLARSSYSESRASNRVSSVDTSKLKSDTSTGSSSDPSRYRSKSLGAPESETAQAQLVDQVSPAPPLPTIKVSNGDLKKPRPITTHGSLSGEGRLRTEDAKRDAQRRSEDLHRLGSTTGIRSTGTLSTVTGLPAWPLQDAGAAMSPIVPMDIARSQTLSTLERNTSSRSQNIVSSQASKQNVASSDRGSLKERSIKRLSSTSIAGRVSSRPMSTGLPSWLAENRPSSAGAKTSAATTATTLQSTPLQKAKVPGPLDYHPQNSMAGQSGQNGGSRPIVPASSVGRPTTSQGPEGNNRNNNNNTSSRKAKTWRRRSGVEAMPQISEVVVMKASATAVRNAVAEDGAEGVKKKKSRFGLSFGRAFT